MLNHCSRFVIPLSNVNRHETRKMAINTALPLEAAHGHGVVIYFRFCINLLLQLSLSSLSIVIVYSTSDVFFQLQISLCTKF